MTTLSSTQPAQQVVSSSLTEAVSAQILADVSALQSDGRARLSALIDGAIEAGIQHAFGQIAESYATQVLGAERSARPNTRGGYRSGRRKITMDSPVGALAIELVKSRKGLLRPPTLKDVRRFGYGIEELVVKLWTHGLSHRSIAEVAPQTLRAEVGRTSVGSWVQEAEAEVLAWLSRPVPPEIRYLMFDGMGVS